MNHMALIGKKLSHSFSKQYFDERFRAEGRTDCEYSLCEMPTVDHIRQWVVDRHVIGFNVTNPFKVDIMAHLDIVDPVASRIGAVNCVTVEDGKLVGHNTDAAAFGNTLDIASGTRALILGTGGAAAAVAYALREKGIIFWHVSRTPQHHPGAMSYAEAAEVLADISLLVNATPVGTWPDSDRSPWPWPENFHHGMLVYDLVYNPSPTRLMRQAADHGARTTDGLAMLHRQASLSWEFYLPHLHP